MSELIQTIHAHPLASCAGTVMVLVLMAAATQCFGVLIRLARGDK